MSRSRPTGSVKTTNGYQALLALCVVGKEALAEGTRRFDMPDFRPRTDWVREMKRSGILLADGDPVGRCVILNLPDSGGFGGG